MEPSTWQDPHRKLQTFAFGAVIKALSHCYYRREKKKVTNQLLFKIKTLNPLIKSGNRLGFEFGGCSCGSWKWPREFSSAQKRCCPPRAVLPKLLIGFPCQADLFSCSIPACIGFPTTQMLLGLTVRERKRTGGVMKHLRFTQKAAKGSCCLMNTW